MKNKLKKIIAYVFPILLILFFIAVMKSGTFLKNPFGHEDDFSQYLSQVESAIFDEDWILATENFTKAKKAWNIVEARVQFSVERVDMLGIDKSISRLGGAIKARSKVQSLISIEEAKNYWEDLEK